MGRILSYECIKGSFKLRFLYDGQLRVTKGDQSVLRDGFGRYCDTMYYKLAVGYWKWDQPYGKQIVYAQDINNGLDVFKQGYFAGDWNRFTEA